MQETTVDNLAVALEQAAVLVDVREPAEFREGRVPGAVNIPMGQLANRLAEIDRSGPVYVVCASGNRSGAMTGFLARAGFDAVTVCGGTSAWARSGRRIES